MVVDGACDRPHQPARSAAIDETHPVDCKDFAKSQGRRDKARVTPCVRPAIHTDSLDYAHVPASGIALAPPSRREARHPADRAFRSPPNTRKLSMGPQSGVIAAANMPIWEAVDGPDPSRHERFMSDFQRPTEHLKREVSAEDGGALVRTIFHLWPYIWPSDRRDLKARVILSLFLLFLAKLATMAVPFTFKWATDALAHEPD